MSKKTLGRRTLAQAIGRAAIQQGYRVLYREAHTLLEALAEATLAETRKAYLAELTAVPLLIIADLGMRTLPHPTSHGRAGPCVIGDPNPADAICDRGLLDAHRLELTAPARRRTNVAPNAPATATPWSGPYRPTAATGR